MKPANHEGLPHSVRHGGQYNMTSPGPYRTSCQRRCDCPPCRNHSFAVKQWERAGDFRGDARGLAGGEIDEGPIRFGLSQYPRVGAAHHLVAPRRSDLLHRGHPGLHDQLVAGERRFEILDLVRTRCPSGKREKSFLYDEVASGGVVAWQYSDPV